MAIEINATRYCKDCRFIDLDLEYIETEYGTYRDGYFKNETQKIHTLRCIHENVCEHWNNKLEEVVKHAGNRST